jgi:hypothetical protein
MAKKPFTRPMECQPFHVGDATPVAPAPTTKAENPRALASAISERQADASRRKSLENQRVQIMLSRKRKIDPAAEE